MGGLLLSESARVADNSEQSGKTAFVLLVDAITASIAGLPYQSASTIALEICEVVSQLHCVRAMS